MIKERDRSGAVAVTFTLPSAVGAHHAAICGDWNEWSPEVDVMDQVESGFVKTVLLDGGRTYRFRYLLDGSRWENDWAADRYEPNRYGTTDSVLDLTALPWSPPEPQTAASPPPVAPAAPPSDAAPSPTGQPPNALHRPNSPSPTKRPAPATSRTPRSAPGTLTSPRRRDLHWSERRGPHHRPHHPPPCLAPPDARPNRRRPPPPARAWNAKRSSSRPPAWECRTSTSWFPGPGPCPDPCNGWMPRITTHPVSAWPVRGSPCAIGEGSQGRHGPSSFPKTARRPISCVVRSASMDRPVVCRIRRRIWCWHPPERRTLHRWHASPRCGVPSRYATGGANFWPRWSTTRSRWRTTKSPVGRFREVEVELHINGAKGRRVREAALTRLVGAGCDAATPMPKLVRALGEPATRPPDVVVPPLPDDATVIDLVRHSVARSVALIIRHDPGARLGDDEEEVHKLRVATRRLRSDLHSFAPLLDPARVNPIRAELSWLGGIIGAVRIPTCSGSASPRVWMPSPRATPRVRTAS